jgi:hypothetical protein
MTLFASYQRIVLQGSRRTINHAPDAIRLIAKGLASPTLLGRQSDHFALNWEKPELDHALRGIE